MNDKKHEAELITKHLISLFQIKSVEEEFLSVDQMATVNDSLIGFELQKVRFFSKAAEIIYSTDNSEIGLTSDEPYFRNVLAGGGIHSKYVEKNTESLEGTVEDRDLVEIYVPVMSKGNFVGAVEIYYDISNVKAIYDKLLRISYLTLAIISSMLLVSLFIAGSCAVTSIKKREEAEERVVRQRDKLQLALKEVKTLRGIIPICSFCKKIRDDGGYWTQVEEYVSQHTEANFSHGLCLECAKKHYPEFESSYSEK